MAPKQRQVRIEQRGAQQAIEALEQRSDEELESETKYKSAALAILGARASERFDAEQARAYFQRAIAAARPQERMQIRRMADASLALAERRAGDLKEAVERLGHTPPSARQMFALRAMGLLDPPRQRRDRGARSRNLVDRGAHPAAARPRFGRGRVDRASVWRLGTRAGDPAGTVLGDRRGGDRGDDRAQTARSGQGCWAKSKVDLSSRARALSPPGFWLAKR